MTSFVFDGIPTDLRVPGWYAYADYSFANSAVARKKQLVIGHMLDTGTAAPLTPMRLVTANDAEKFWGRGAQITLMVAIAFANNPLNEIWGIGLEEATGSSAATGSQTLSNNVAVAGGFRVDAAGEFIHVEVYAGDTPETVATSIAAALTQRTDLPFTAVATGAKVDYTARHKGECGNEIAIEITFIGDGVPGMTFDNAAIQLSGGTVNPDIAPALAAVNSDWHRWIAMPFTDATNMTTLENWLLDRFGPMQKKGARAITAKSGTHGQVLAYGDSRNCEHVACVGASKTPHPAWLWAAAFATVVANEMATHSSRPMTDVPVRGLRPPKVQDRWGFDQHKPALHDGISTYNVDAAGIIRVSRIITMRQVTAQGHADNSRLDIMALEQYEDYRIDQQLLMAPHVRDLLADDPSGGEDELPSNVPIMTPNMHDGILSAWYRNDQVKEKGRCMNPADYQPESRRVNDRIEFVDNPQFTKGLIQVVGRSDIQA